MDQSASLRGASGHAVFLDCRDQSVELVPFQAREAGLVLLVIDTKVAHSHADGGYASRRASCELGAEVLGVKALRDVAVADLEEASGLLDPVTFRRVRHIVTENDRVLQAVDTLRSQGPAHIGALLDASHASMRDDFEISCPELDLAVDTARGHGAIGARMTGGGFGGSAIALTPVRDEQQVRDAVVPGLRGRRVHRAGHLHGHAGGRSGAPVLTSIAPHRPPRLASSAREPCRRGPKRPFMTPQKGPLRSSR